MAAKKTTTSSLCLPLLRLVFLFAVAVAVSSIHGVQARKLRRPGVKLTKRVHGVVYDCIDIHKQPAFENPLLRKHEIQRRPSNCTFVDAPFAYDSHVLAANYAAIKIKAKKIKLHGKSVQCPRGTVPVPRKNNSGKGKTRVFTDELLWITNRPYASNSHTAGIKMSKEDTYTGGAAIINAWNPSVELDKSTCMRLRLESMDGDDEGTRNVVQVGWMANPMFYNDTRPMFFTAWTRDNWEATGCIDMDCPGFILTDPDFPLGRVPLHPVSIYGGQQYEMSVSIRQDLQTQHWWLYFADKQVGYWPKELFSSLRNGARVVGWSADSYDGAVMGSGHFPSEGFKKAAYIRSMTAFRGNQGSIMADDDTVVPDVDLPNCWPVGYARTLDNYHSLVMFAGGPGGSLFFCD